MRTTAACNQYLSGQLARIAMVMKQNDRTFIEVILVFTPVYTTPIRITSLPISCLFPGFNISMPDKGNIWV
jgi:hypothetical protein